MNATLENDKITAMEDYFLLATRNWDEKLEDYLPVDDPSTAVRVFHDYADAENAYFSMGSSSQAGEVKIELIHMRFRVPHIVRNQILFS
jgi:hypothetical protein